MLKKTHIEGGKTAFKFTSVFCLALYPFKNTDYTLILMALIVMYSSCIYASTMKDLDHHEGNMPTKGLVSYCIHCISQFFDKNHRSIITHNILIDIAFWLVPAIYIRFIGFKYLSCPQVAYLLFCFLMAMFGGNLAHYILDRFTVEGTYKLYALPLLIKYKIQKKDISRIRKGLKGNFIFRKSALLITTKKPFIHHIPVEDYGKTGGRYEAIFNVNLRSFNHVLTYAMIFYLCNPDYKRLYLGMKEIIKLIIN